MEHYPYSLHVAIIIGLLGTSASTILDLLKQQPRSTIQLILKFLLALIGFTIIILLAKQIGLPTQYIYLQAFTTALRAESFFKHLTISSKQLLKIIRKLIDLK